jgi:hypothetical protein
MQTVQIESSCEYPTIRDILVVGFICASCPFHIHDSEIMRDFRVDLVLAAMSALDDSIVGSVIVGWIVGSVIVGSIVGSAISTLELCLFLFFPFSAVNKSAVAGNIIYMTLISFPARVQEDGEVMEHFPS